MTERATPSALQACPPKVRLRASKTTATLAISRGHRLFFINASFSITPKFQRAAPQKASIVWVRHSSRTSSVLRIGLGGSSWARPVHGSLGRRPGGRDLDDVIPVFHLLQLKDDIGPRLDIFERGSARLEIHGHPRPLQLCYRIMADVDLASSYIH